MEDFLYAIRGFDGFFYYVFAIICIILIMAIIGYLMERDQLLKLEEANRQSETPVHDDAPSVIPLVEEAKEITPSPVEDMIKPKVPEVIDFNQSVVAKASNPENTSSAEAVIPEIVPSQDTVTDMKEGTEPSLNGVLELNSSDVLSSEDPSK